MLVSRGYSGDVKKSGEDCKEKIRNWAVENAACQFRRSTVGKRKPYAVVVEGWKVVSGAEVEPEESVTIVVEHVH